MSGTQKTGEPMWFSGFAIDEISLKLLSELWKAGPDRMLV